MAKDAGEIIVDGSELLRTLRIGVRLPKGFALRMWMATKLFELAGTISGTTVVIEVDDSNTDEAGA
ncbi:hypothetical protein [Rhizobium grahamii]|uniref:Uncharacterized protein n=1 Tax=Rhizobium grahamii CCGE 502 TaxID=990285 RepID=S3I8Q2_9HYPH|nr:hypothetical protein [Rhizobium grahamii]EPE95723.1 hypothetical protein RGCCGE502_22775 [Rhizobium grahamii CCGE 502]